GHAIFMWVGRTGIFTWATGERESTTRRIMVLDANGNFLRQWQPEGMDTVHCMTIADDGTIYVCNRTGSRIQLYDKAGQFKRNIDLPWQPVTPPAHGQIKQNARPARPAPPFARS